MFTDIEYFPLQHWMLTHKFAPCWRIIQQFRLDFPMFINSGKERQFRLSKWQDRIQLFLAAIQQFFKILLWSISSSAVRQRFHEFLPELLCVKLQFFQSGDFRKVNFIECGINNKTLA